MPSGAPGSITPHWKCACAPRSRGVIRKKEGESRAAVARCRPGHPRHDDEIRSREQVAGATELIETLLAPIENQACTALPPRAFSSVTTKLVDPMFSAPYSR